MTNTSATGGPLLPSGPDLAPDLDFDRVLSRLVGGITGLAPGMVHPRWQEDPPDEPSKGEDWCAVGVVDITSDDGLRPVFEHDSSGDGSSTLTRYQTLKVIASFYGPSAAGRAGLFRDGLTLSQNREALIPDLMTVRDIGNVVMAPALTNTTWRRRADITITFARAVKRTYPILNVLKGVGAIEADGGLGSDIKHTPFSAPET